MRELKLKYLRYTIIHQKDTINWKIYYKSKYTIKVSLKLFNRAVNEKQEVQSISKWFGIWSDLSGLNV